MMANKQNVISPLLWKIIQKTILSICILCTILFLNSCDILVPKCEGFECRGEYKIEKDTLVKIDKQVYSLKKGEKLIVGRKSVEIVKYVRSPVPQPNPFKSKFNTNCNFSPNLPTDNESTLKAIVELGATGFNYFVVKVNYQKEWKIIEKEFGRSAVFEHQATRATIERQLREYINKIINLEGSPVRGNHIHFIVSSGANKTPIVRKAIEVLRDEIGYVVNVVTPEEEAYYAYLSAVPNNYDRTKCFAIDIGSSNTKIAWQNNHGEIIGKEVNKGSKYYKLGIADNDVYSETYNTITQIPNDNRAICFIIGGLPFMLAKDHRNGKEKYTCLKAPNEYADESDKKRKAGLNIYKAIADASECKHFVFDWDANFAIGFLISL